MRYLIFIGIVGVVLASLCIQQNANVAGVGLTEVMESPDIYLKFESIPTEVKVGRNMTLTYIAQDKQPFDLENLTIDAYDLCLFSGQQRVLDSIELKSNKTKQVSFKYTANPTNFESDCTLKFRTQYQSTFSLSQDVIVLSESEYYIREQQGTLSNLTASSSSSSNPISLTLTFSENQPFLTGDSFNMYIDYSNTGSGFIDKLEAGSITIRIPANMNVDSCSGYLYSSTATGGGTLVLNRDLSFIDNKAPRTTCRVSVTAGQLIDSKTLFLTANYKYALDNSIIVKVRPS